MHFIDQPVFRSYFMVMSYDFSGCIVRISEELSYSKSSSEVVEVFDETLEVFA